MILVEFRIYNSEDTYYGFEDEEEAKKVCDDNNIPHNAMEVYVKNEKGREMWCRYEQYLEMMSYVTEFITKGTVKGFKIINEEE